MNLFMRFTMPDNATLTQRFLRSIAFCVWNGLPRSPSYTDEFESRSTSGEDLELEAATIMIGVLSRYVPFTL